MFYKYDGDTFIIHVCVTSHAVRETLRISNCYYYIYILSNLRYMDFRKKN